MGSNTPVPRKLEGAVSRVRLVGADNTMRAVASRRTGEELSRESLSALYTLASRLHSPQLQYHAKTLETSKAKHISVEQIWGQMGVLLRPVLRRLQDSVRRAEKLYSAAPAASSRKTFRGAPVKDADDASGDASDEDQPPRAAPLSMLPGDSEDDLDEEIAALLEEQKRRRVAKTRKGKSDDSWRYAFGKGNEEDDDDWGLDADDLQRDREGSGEDSDRDGDRHARDRNTRAMMDADNEGNDAAEELAALKELYGEDFEGDDGIAFGGTEEDHDLEDDLHLDDPENEGIDGDLYDEQRDGGRFFGRADMLNDEAGDFDDPTAVGYSPTGGEEDAVANEEDGELDEELMKMLQDPNLTELERERLIERRHVERLEQERLYGTDWTMAGETAASKRPREGLLDVEDLEFEHGMRAVPVITEAFTARLEDRIKQRILDKNFDDVQRRSAMTNADTLVNTKRDAALDSEKSKFSLMDLYEKEYMDKMQLADEARGEAAAAEPLTEIERDELRAINMWKRLSQHLDALSNFFYTPKPVQQELDARVRAVENQAPAIAVETVGNFATTRESALAPQDLFRGSSRKLADVGVEEMRPEERRALRRAKKDAGKEFKERAEVRKQQYANQRKQLKQPQSQVQGTGRK